MAIKIDGIKVAGLANEPKSAFELAQSGGYTGSEQEFNMILATAASTSYVNEQIEENKITKVSELTNDKGYLTSYTETDPTVPAWAKASTKPSYTAAEVGAAANTDLSALSATVTSLQNTVNSLQTTISSMSSKEGVLCSVGCILGKTSGSVTFSNACDYVKVYERTFNGTFDYDDNGNTTSGNLYSAISLLDIIYKGHSTKWVQSGDSNYCTASLNAEGTSFSISADRQTTLIIHAYKGGTMVGTIHTDSLKDTTITVPTCSYIDVYHSHGTSGTDIMTNLILAGSLYKNGVAMPLVGGSSSTEYQSYWYLNTEGTQVICSDYDRTLGYTTLVCYK